MTERVRELELAKILLTIQNIHQILGSKWLFEHGSVVRHIEILFWVIILPQQMDHLVHYYKGKRKIFNRGNIQNPVYILDFTKFSDTC